MIQLVAFDMAGTTVEEGGAVYRALHDAVVAHGSTATTEDVARWMGADKRTAIAALLRGGAGGVDELEETFTDFGRLLRRAYDDVPPVAMPGVEDAFALLRDSGTQVALTTGFSRDVVDMLLERLGWHDGVVDTVVCTDDVPAGRPAPYMIHTAMQRTGVTAVAGVAAVGDTILDLEAGTNAGAGVVAGVLTGSVPREILAGAPHTHILETAAEIVGVVAATVPV